MSGTLKKFLSKFYLRNDNSPCSRTDIFSISECLDKQTLMAEVAEKPAINKKESVKVIYQKSDLSTLSENSEKSEIAIEPEYVMQLIGNVNRLRAVLKSYPTRGKTLERLESDAVYLKNLLFDIVKGGPKLNSFKTEICVEDVDMGAGGDNVGVELRCSLKQTLELLCNIKQLKRALSYIGNSELKSKTLEALSEDETYLSDVVKFLRVLISDKITHKKLKEECLNYVEKRRNYIRAFLTKLKNDLWFSLYQQDDIDEGMVLSNTDGLRKLEELLKVLHKRPTTNLSKFLRRKLVKKVEGMFWNLLIIDVDNIL